MDDSDVGVGGGQRLRHPRLRDLRGVQGFQEHSEPAGLTDRHGALHYNAMSFGHPSRLIPCPSKEVSNSLV